MSNICSEAEALRKKRWEKPSLEVLVVRDTAYCEFVINPETGFFMELCHGS